MIKLVRKNDNNEEFIDINFKISAVTAKEIDELQTSINEDDQGLFEYLLWAIEETGRVAEEKEKIKLNTSPIVNEVKHVNVSKSFESDDDVLDSFYNEDHR